MKKERICTVKNANDFTYNRNEETKFSFNLPSDMIFQIINHGNLCKDSSREYMLANTRKEITMKIHDYWKDHSEILYPRSSRSYMWLYYNEIARKRLRTLQEENIKQLSYMIYMMNKTKKGEMSVSEQRKWWNRFLDFTYYRFLFLWIVNVVNYE